MTRKIRLFHCPFPAKYEIQFDSIFWGVLDGGNIRNCADKLMFNISDKLEHFYINSRQNEMQNKAEAWLHMAAGA